MKTVSVILARGGSKGIPGKNIINLNGKPLIYYTLQASIMSNVQETWVSTDSDLIGQVAMEYGAKIIKRPDEFALDTSKSEEALVHFCQNIDAEYIVFIQPTSPLLLSSDINKGLNKIKKFDSIFSGYLEHWVPRWNLYSETDTLIEQSWNRHQRPRRQDRENVVVENGAFYIAKRENILKSNLRYSGKIGWVEMPFERSFQIDSLSDLFIAESLLKNSGGDRDE